LILAPVYHAKGGAVAMVLSTLAVWTVAHFHARRHIGHLPFFEATLRPLLIVAISMYIYSLINTPWLGIISALVIYITGALIIDWKLPRDIRSLIRIKDGRSVQTLESRSTPVNKRVILAIFCVLLFLVIWQIKPFPIATWLNPAATELKLTSMVRGIEILKYLLEVDIIIVLALLGLLYKTSNSLDSHYHPLWKGYSLQEEHSICETYFFPMLFGILLLALLFQFQSILPGNTVWTEEIIDFISYLKLDYGALITHFERGNQQMLFSLLAKISVVLFGENDFSLHLSSMIIRIACIWAIASLVRYIFNARDAIIAAILFTAFSYQILLLQNTSGYAIVFFTTALATELFLRNLETGKWRYGLGYAFLIAATSWLYFSTLFIILAHCLVYLTALIRTAKWNRTHWRPFWVLVLSAWITLHFYIPVLSQLDNHYLTN
jgi:hypothetical protein